MRRYVPLHLLRNRVPPGRLHWADLVVIPLVLVFSVPPLVWFYYHFQIVADPGRYLLDGWHLISGRGYTTLLGAPDTKHGPVFPGLLGLLMVFFGRDPVSLAMAVRLVAQLAPLLAYLLVRRVSSPVAGLVAAVLVAMLDYTALSPEAVNIDSALLVAYLISLLLLMAAVDKNAAWPALASGLALGAAILLKETVIVNLPLAALTGLLLGFNRRCVVWHYLGVLAVCVPWWAWVWIVGDQIFLVGRLPDSSQLLLFVAAMIVVILTGVWGWYSGILARIFADESRRGRPTLLAIGLAVGWVVLMSFAFLTFAGPALSRFTLSGLQTYLFSRVAPDIRILPLLGVGAIYAFWQAFRSGGTWWRLFALALFFQVPVVLFIVVSGWDARQLLVFQVLLLCALGALLTDAFASARDARNPRRRLGVGALAFLLAIYPVAAGIVQFKTMLLSNHANPYSGVEGARPGLAMVRWMDENVPAGQSVVVSVSKAAYVQFLDGDEHTVKPLGMDQSLCVPNPAATSSCDPASKALSRLPSSTVWFTLNPRCEAASLSMKNLVKQTTSDDGSGWLMLAGVPTYPGTRQLAGLLAKSGAFEIAHSVREGYILTPFPPGREGMVLLKAGEQGPRQPVPTQTSMTSMLELAHCERAKGAGYRERIRATFDHGIVLTADPGHVRTPPEMRSRLQAAARRKLISIYRQGHR